MEKKCRNCQWFGSVNLLFQCQFPLPYWVLRELHHPYTGGALASVVGIDHGENCATFEQQQ